MRTYINKRNGDTISTDMPLLEAVNNLPQDNKFAQSLASQWKRQPNRMSETQLYWIMKLAREADQLHKCDTAKIIELLQHGKLVVNLKDFRCTIYPDGKIWMRGKYIGKYTTEGIILQGDVDKELIHKFFMTFAKHGSAAFDRIGVLGGVCCYCGIKLTHPISIGLGRGPICSDNRGLPFPWDEYNKSIKK